MLSTPIAKQAQIRRARQNQFTQCELRRRLRRDLTRLRGERTSTAFGGGGIDRGDVAFAHFEPWLRQTTTALKRPLAPNVLVDIVEHWRTRRVEFIFDDNTIANVVIIDLHRNNPRLR